MLLGCIADDFTGASDIANTLSRSGMRTRLFFGRPSDSTTFNPAEFEAVVIALKSRSIEPALAVRLSLDALEWLQRFGAKQVVFKYCSTFDSTPLGNIGPVAEALAKKLGVQGVVVCPSFPENGRTVYQGHLFVGDQLLNRSGMQNHPVTPMQEPDIRRVLQEQCETTVGHIEHGIIRGGSVAISDALRRHAETGHNLIVTDAVTDEDLLAIAGAVRNEPLVTGGSAIAAGLTANFVNVPLHGEYPAIVGPRRGPGLVLSGSCSRNTLKQVETYVRSHPAIEIDVSELADGKDLVATALSFIRDNLALEPIVFTTSSEAEVCKVHSRFGREIVSDRTEAFFANLAKEIATLGIRRLVVAGGETSGAVVQALELVSLDVGPEIAPGVPGLYSGEADSGLVLALKSGNFGAIEFFSDALQQMEAGYPRA